MYCIVPLFALDEPPKITDHPENQSNVSPGTAATFTIQTTGTKPLSYQWQWKPAEEGDGSEEWRPCDVEEPTLTIPSVQKSHEGEYRCVVYNHAGRQITKPAKLEVSGKCHVENFDLRISSSCRNLAFECQTICVIVLMWDMLQRHR